MPTSDLWTIRVPIDVRELADQPASNKSALLARVREIAPDPTIFDGEGAPVPFLWRTIISTNKIDSYSTEMLPSTLKNFAEDAANGVPVLESHNSRNLPIGRSLTGTFKGSQGTGVATVRADAYMTPGLHNGRISTDDMIRGIRTGVYSDASVGFYGGTITCSICNEAMFGRESACPHWPGDTYTNEKGAAQVAIGRIGDAHLGEYSMVYDGATPGAMVEKVYRMVGAGEMEYPDFVRLQRRYGLTVDSPYRLVSSNKTNDLGAMTFGNALGLTPWQVDSMPADFGERLSADVLDRITEALAKRQEQPEPKPEGGNMGNEENREQSPETVSVKLEEINAGIRAALTDAGAPVDSTVRWMVDEIRRLRPDADAGRAYRSDLIEDTIAEGIRAKGADNFAAETYRGMLAGMTLDQIKQIRADFKEIAAKVLPTGRQTTDGEAPPNDDQEAEDRRRFAAAAYRS